MIEWDSKDHSVLSFASSGTKSSLADGVSIHGLPGKPPHCLATSSPGKSSLQPSLAAHNSTGPLPMTLTGREVMKEPSQDSRLHKCSLLGALDNPSSKQGPPQSPDYSGHLLCSHSKTSIGFHTSSGTKAARATYKRISTNQGLCSLFLGVWTLPEPQASQPAFGSVSAHPSHILEN